MEVHGQFDKYIKQLKKNSYNTQKSIFESGPRDLFRGMTGCKEIIVNPSRIAKEMKGLFGQKKGNNILSDFCGQGKENIHTVYVIGRLLEAKKRHLEGKTDDGGYVLEALCAIDQSYSKHNLDRLFLRDCFRHANMGKLNGEERKFYRNNTYSPGSLPHLEHFFQIGSGKSKA